MKQISKAEFIRKVTSKPTLFIMDHNSEYFPGVKERLEKHASEPRTCKCLSNNHLVFTSSEGNSHLYLADVKPHTFYTCYEDGDLLSVKQEYHDSFDDTITTKWLYYKEV